MQLGPIKSGSVSRLQVYEECPFRAFLQYAEKIPEPERQGEDPRDRGSRIHGYAEDYVLGKTDALDRTLNTFEPEYTRLRQMYSVTPDSVITEQMWCFDTAWQPVDSDNFTDTWLRVKLDHLAYITPEFDEAVVADTKTGRVYPVKHAMQGQMYGLSAVLRDERIAKIHTEFWYVDQDQIKITTYTRAQIMRYLEGFNNRFIRMTTATDFPPKPNTHNCRFCPYKIGRIGKNGPMGTGHCKEAPDQ